MPTTPKPLPNKVLDALFREARTANAFTDDPVPEAAEKLIYELFKYGPTSFNGQPLRIFFVRSEDARERLVTHMIEPNQEKTKNAPLVALLAADLKFHENLPKTFPHFPIKDMFFTEKAVIEEESITNSWLQIGYFILAVRAAGLWAGPQGGFDADGVAKDFFPEGNIKPLLVVNIGLPGDNAWFPDRLPRLELEEVVTVL